MPVGLQAGNACIEEFGRDRQMGCRIETLARRRPDMMQCKDRTQAAGADISPVFENSDTASSPLWMTARLSVRRAATVFGPNMFPIRKTLSAPG
jgi:hypothetical protein